MTQTITLPAPRYPLVSRLVTSPIFGDPTNPDGTPALNPDGSKKRAEPIVWALSKPNPLTEAATIVRMFVVEEGIEIYSIAQNGGPGIRNTIPFAMVRIVEEVMPPEVFAAVLGAASDADAEDDPDDDDEPDDDEPEGLPPAPPTAP